MAWTGLDWTGLDFRFFGLVWVRFGFGFGFGWVVLREYGCLIRLADRFICTGGKVICFGYSIEVQCRLGVISFPDDVHLILIRIRI